MKNLLKDIVKYLKKSYLNHPDLENYPTKISVIQSIYNDIDEIFDKHDVKYNWSPEKRFGETWSKMEIERSGGYVKILRENSFAKNMKSISIKKFYPHIIRLFYLNNVEGCISFKSYVFMVEHYYEIVKKLNKKEELFFRIIINYKFGIIFKYNEDLGHKITSFARTVWKNLLELDEYQDIFYIDTDHVIFYDDTDINEVIENYFKDFLDIETDYNNKSIYFIAKKKYIMINDLDTVKMRGITVMQRYKDKDLKNYAYKLYSSGRENPLTYNQFNSTINREISYPYIETARKIVRRRKKLERILK